MWLQLVGSYLVAALVFQLFHAGSVDRKFLLRIVGCNDHLRRRLRSAIITFSLNVFPGGSPFVVHCLDYERDPILCRGLIIFTMGLIVALAPIVSIVHAFGPTQLIPCTQYRRGGAGMYKGKRGWKLFRFLLKHPFAIEGEGVGNGAGLAIYSAAESLTYPDGMYDRYHELFHDKIWQDEFFTRLNVPRAKVFSIWKDGKEERRTVGEVADADKDKIEWIWKPVFATMGLGIYPCTDMNKPPSKAVYFLVEQVMPGFHNRAEWFRISTLWPFDDSVPKFGYCWRTHNNPTDTRVQTDIIGGHAVLLKGGPRPFVGTYADYGQDESNPGHHGFYDWAENKWHDASKYRDALLQAYDYALKMHREIGKELPNIGWDVMVRESGPVFLEFNINNGFLITDHGVDQCERMIQYVEDEYDKRIHPAVSHAATAAYRASLKKKI